MKLKYAYVALGLLSAFIFLYLCFIWSEANHLDMELYVAVSALFSSISGIITIVLVYMTFNNQKNDTKLNRTIDLIKTEIITTNNKINVNSSSSRVSSNSLAGSIIDNQLNYTEISSSMLWINALIIELTFYDSLINRLINSPEDKNIAMSVVFRSLEQTTINVFERYKEIIKTIRFDETYKSSYLELQQKNEVYKISLSSDYRHASDKNRLAVYKRDKLPNVEKEFQNLKSLHSRLVSIVLKLDKYDLILMDR